ncbi:unnamed protein product, partial [Prorocentrum cordatum]
GGPRPQEYDYHLGEAVVRLPEDEARVLRTEMQHAEIFADGEGGEAPWKLLLEFEDAPPAAAAASAPEAAAAPPLPPPARPPAAQDGQPLESRDRVPQHLKDRTTRSSITRVQPRPPRRWRRRGSSPRPTVRRASRCAGRPGRSRGQTRTWRSWRTAAGSISFFHGRCGTAPRRAGRSRVDRGVRARSAGRGAARPLLAGESGNPPDEASRGAAPRRAQSAARRGGASALS